MDQSEELDARFGAKLMRAWWDGAHLRVLGRLPGADAYLSSCVRLAADEDFEVPAWARAELPRIEKAASD